MSHVKWFGVISTSGIPFSFSTSNHLQNKSSKVSLVQRNPTFAALHSTTQPAYHASCDCSLGCKHSLDHLASRLLFEPFSFHLYLFSLSIYQGLSKSSSFNVLSITWPLPPNSIVRFRCLLSSVIIFSLSLVTDSTRVICTHVSLAHYPEVNGTEIPCPSLFSSSYFPLLVASTISASSSVFFSSFLLFLPDLLLLYNKYHFSLARHLPCIISLSPNSSLTTLRSISSIWHEPMSQLRFAAFITMRWVNTQILTCGAWEPQLIPKCSLTGSPQPCSVPCTQWVLRKCPLNEWTDVESSGPFKIS